MFGGNQEWTFRNIEALRTTPMYNGSEKMDGALARSAQRFLGMDTLVGMQHLMDIWEF
jgi:hypothetical protein